MQPEKQDMENMSLKDMEDKIQNPREKKNFVIFLPEVPVRV